MIYDFFFLGDGRLAAAIQIGREGAAPAYGLLLIGNPEHASRPASTLLFHPDLGLQRTMLTVTLDGVRHTAQPGNLHARHATDGDRPCVIVTWQADAVTVTECFSVQNSHLLREIHVENAESYKNISLELALYANPTLFNQFAATDEGTLTATGHLSLQIEAHPQGHPFERFLTVTGKDATFTYAIKGISQPPLPIPVPHLHLSPLTSHLSPKLPSPNLLNLCRTNLRAVTSQAGRFQAAIWQYDFEWGLDAAMAASAAVCAGDFLLGRQILANILSRLSNEQGMIAEAGRFRGGEMSELNGNGAVLDALRRYRDYTGDDAFIREGWERIAAITGYPLRPEFRHPSGLLLTRRDFWERTPWMGVGRGFELGHQTLCAAGLRSAAALAGSIGMTEQAVRWREAGDGIAWAMLHHPEFALVDEGRFVRRRHLDGSVEKFLSAGGYDDPGYAPYLPATYDPAPKACEPDATESLPIVYGLVDPGGELAMRTLGALESLWSPCGTGGYARYNIASDPDSPGAWPFATAFIAAAELECGMTERAGRSLRWLTEIAGESGSWFEFYGSRREPPYPPVGVIVWGWAQYIILCVEHILGIRVTGSAVRIAPRLTGYGHTLRIGSHAIAITVTGLGGAVLDGAPVASDGGAVTLSLPLTHSSLLEFIP